jgi:hypothetical protein
MNALDMIGETSPFHSLTWVMSEIGCFRQLTGKSDRLRLPHEETQEARRITTPPITLVDRRTRRSHQGRKSRSHVEKVSNFIQSHEGEDTRMHACCLKDDSTLLRAWARVGRVGPYIHNKENHMKTLMTICFALPLLTFGVASAQDTMQNDNMKADASKKAVQVTGKISDDGMTFVSDKDSKSWTIANPDAVKGHEGHHVTLTAHVYADKGQVHVVSLKMAK